MHMFVYAGSQGASYINARTRARAHTHTHTGVEGERETLFSPASPREHAVHRKILQQLFHKHPVLDAAPFLFLFHPTPFPLSFFNLHPAP